jgi:hypothetical protein
MDKLTTFSPAKAKLKRNFRNEEGFWISLPANTIVYVLGRSYVNHKETGAVDVSFVTTDYKVPFSRMSKSGYIPTNLLDFNIGQYQYDPQFIPFMPAIPNIQISNKPIVPIDPNRPLTIITRPKNREGGSRKYIKKISPKKISRRKTTKKISRRKSTKKISRRKVSRKKSTKKVSRKKVSRKKSTKKVSRKKSTKKVSRKKSTKKVSRKKSTKKVSSRKNICRKNKIGRVMKEFKSGKLKMKSGNIVTKRKQAIAIALSESDKYC